MTQLKIKIIETQKARLLVVGGLPEDAREMAHGRPLINSMISYKSSIDNYKYTAIVPIPTADWRLLGKLSEITEEQWKGIVETHPVVGGFGYYKDTVPSFFNTASMAGLSLIESEVCLKNPHGEQPKLSSYSQGDMFSFEDNESNAAAFACDFSEWQAAEEQVFHNPILFVEFKK